MSTLSPALGSIAHHASNLAFNLMATTGTAYYTSQALQKHDPRDVAIIVALDTVFRSGISHILYAIGMRCSCNSNATQLVSICLPLATQPLSVRVARKFFQVQAPDYISTFGYIAFSWKANMIIYCSICTLKSYLAKS